MISKVKWIVNFCLLFTALYLPSVSWGQSLSLETLKQFSDHINEISSQTPVELYPFLSDSLVVEVNLGSNAQGVSLNYDKQEYMEMLEKLDAEGRYQKNIENSEVHIYNHMINSPTSGQYSIVSYSKTTRVKAWVTVDVVIEGDKLKIIKLVEEM
ncbi:hypothetical protein [Thalassotalea sp. PS06]|uniref:hypothetical protein n=1 Tax=Thalassotalea sp. PS06 TaxID=2594005 RepID=UPI001164655D|nr:hypothetical protein [Thalassotalea sp. PS06]QDP01314.1 hypothetical protein FNC98_08175 [Thalassotalea sp. PS06]